VSDGRRRGAGRIVMWVVFTVLMGGAAGVGTAYYLQRTGAEQARVDRAAELEAARAKLVDQKKELTYATTNRDQAQARAKVAEAQFRQDLECVEYIRGILREMRQRAGKIEVDMEKCRE